jgi:hypothetical protein
MSLRSLKQLIPAGDLLEIGFETMNDMVEAAIRQEGQVNSVERKEQKLVISAKTAAARPERQPNTWVSIRLLPPGLSAPSSQSKSSPNQDFRLHRRGEKPLITVEGGLADQVQLTITIEGRFFNLRGEISLPQLENLKLIGGPSLSTQFSLVNGKRHDVRDLRLASQMPDDDIRV